MSSNVVLELPICNIVSKPLYEYFRNLLRSVVEELFRGRVIIRENTLVRVDFEAERRRVVRRLAPGSSTETLLVLSRPIRGYIDVTIRRVRYGVEIAVARLRQGARLPRCDVRFPDREELSVESLDEALRLVDELDYVVEKRFNFYEQVKRDLEASVIVERLGDLIRSGEARVKLVRRSVSSRVTRGSETYTEYRNMLYVVVELKHSVFISGKLVLSIDDVLANMNNDVEKLLEVVAFMTSCDEVGNEAS